jgi:hypothetical protein
VSEPPDEAFGPPQLAESPPTIHHQFLSNIHEALPEMKALAAEIDEWDGEDLIYRFWHQSFKVFGLQNVTERIAELLVRIAPKKSESSLDEWFVQIVSEGTGKEFSLEDNDRWLEATRPILEAYFHARYFLDMAIRYGEELEEPPELLSSGWAALLSLYGIRNG